MQVLRQDLNRDPLHSWHRSNHSTTCVAIGLVFNECLVFKSFLTYNLHLKVTNCQRHQFSLSSSLSAVFQFQSFGTGHLKTGKEKHNKVRKQEKQNCTHCDMIVSMSFTREIMQQQSILGLCDGPLNATK